MGVGGALLAIGVLMWVIAGVAFNEADSGWIAEGSTGTTLQIADEDGRGDIGFSFFVKADYTDSDDDGVWDHCQDFDITVAKKPESGWDDEDGDFYFQSSREGERTCDVGSGADKSRPGFAKVGHACLGCYRGEFQFEANQQVWIIYSDEALGDFFGGIFVGAGGSSCICCGILLLVLGLIMGLTMEEKPATSFQIDEEGKIILDGSEPDHVASREGHQRSPPPGEEAGGSGEPGEGASDDVDAWYKQTGD